MKKLATHLIKLEARFKTSKTEEAVKKLVDKGIDILNHPEGEAKERAEIELFNFEKNKLDLWVYISELGVEEWVVNEWLDEHLNELELKDDVEIRIEEIEPQYGHTAKGYGVLIGTDST